MREPSLYEQAQQEWLVKKDGVKVGQVYDSDSSFFVVTGIEYSNNMVFVTGDIVNDHERRQMLFLAGRLCWRNSLPSIWKASWILISGVLFTSLNCNKSLISSECTCVAS